MSRKIPLVAGIAAAIVVTILIVRALTPETTRIRRVLEGMADGFNDSSAGRTVSGLTEDFLEESAGVDKIEIRQFLLYIFLNERDERTKEFLYRLELAEPEIVLADGEGKGKGKEAKVRVRVSVFQTKSAAAAPIWVVDVDGSLRKEDGAWKIHRARHKQVSGRRPF